MNIKLHVGNGTIYLRDWINCDIKGSRMFYAFERPDLVAQYETTEDDYYGKHKSNDIARFRAGPREAQSVCDVDAHFQKLPFPNNFADEILSRQVWEHMSITEARVAREECLRVLKPNGILRLDVPDFNESLSKLAETGDPFYARNILGPIAKGDLGYHCVGYTRESLRELIGASPSRLDPYKFIFMEEEPNIHCYPAFCLKFRKSI